MYVCMYVCIYIYIYIYMPYTKYIMPQIAESRLAPTSGRSGVGAEPRGRANTYAYIYIYIYIVCSR